MTLQDLIATCRVCRRSITWRTGWKGWQDASGSTRCRDHGDHAPEPAGTAGAPVEVPGIPDEPEPRLWGTSS